MQERQKNRRLYFQELATTSKKYYIPYIEKYKAIESNMNILEIGCGDGGNLLPFSTLGCNVTGIDMAECRIKDAKDFFREANTQGRFLASDIFKFNNLNQKFDIIICHDVLEHIADKTALLIRLKDFLSESGIIFMSFPAWQMPFGGHQQICHNRLISHFPFIHLLPTSLYTGFLRCCNEKEETINELLDIKRTQCSIELFRKIALRQGYCIVNQELYFINPHYEVKFGLKPCKLPFIISAIPYIRNFFTTSCFYILADSTTISGK